MTEALYPAALGNAFGTLPGPVRDFHDGASTRTWTGQADITRGRNPLAHLICRMFGFPPAGTAVPCRLTVTPDASGETWAREFGAHALTTHQRPGQPGAVVETLGPAKVTLRLDPGPDALRITFGRCTLLGLPLLSILSPTGSSTESTDGRAFTFDVTVTQPGFGLIFSYRGTLERDIA